MSYKRTLNDDECKLIGKEFGELLNRNAIIVNKLSSDGGLEDIINLIAELIAKDREVQKEEIIIHILEACEDQLRNAAMNYYISWK